MNCSRSFSSEASSPRPLFLDLPRGLKPHFRIKIIDPDDPRRLILAFADRIAPADREDIESGRQSILPVEYVDLGQQIWNLRMDDSLAPVLQLNSKIEEPVGIATLGRTAEFAALVYPSVIRQILARLLLEGDDLGSNADHDWLKYGHVLISRPCPEYEDYGEDRKLTDWEEQAAARYETGGNPGIAEVLCKLYWDDNDSRPKRGAAPNKKTPGTLRRFGDMIKQFSLTYDLSAIKADGLLDLLPAEFDKWK